MASHSIMGTEIDSGEMPTEEGAITASIEAVGRRRGVTPISPSAHAQWPFVERRRSQTDRRQNGGARVFMHGGTASNSPDELHAPTELRAPDFSHVCTVREQQILRLLLQGMTNKRIAQQLGIVEDTVKKHLQHIYDKLGVRRRTLVMLGRRGE